MTSAGSARGPSPLDAALDVFRVRQYFDVLTRARDLAVGVAADLGFLGTVGRAVLPLPRRRPRPHGAPFPTERAAGVPALTGRVGVVSTGGSGALASLIGVARAFEETGTRVAVWSLCSGGALFGFPLAAGLSAAETARLVGSLEPRKHVDVSWRDLGRALLDGDRGWAGLVRGNRLEEFYRRRLGDRTLGELVTPAYAPIWNIETNTVEYLGPRTYPDLPVARAVRLAVSLPLFVQPAALGGRWWCDGGIVDIFPVHPVLDIEPPVDTALAVNAFYPPGFAGEDATGWERRRLSLLAVAGQVRTSQQVQLARENLARLHAAARVLMVEPVPYRELRGTGFYAQFLDPSGWPEFMRAGRRTTLDALRDRPDREPPPAPGPPSRGNGRPDGDGIEAHRS
ncbi:patatin-like phospholipase family protein [Trujillonella humicola]|uniref:patatin-like phospholipase family protein n=1 Tax=Trujillonella humicola TaxID=3383699 RepID=UPI00390576D2